MSRAEEVAVGLAMFLVDGFEEIIPSQDVMDRAVLVALSELEPEEDLWSVQLAAYDDERLLDMNGRNIDDYFVAGADAGRM